MSDSALAGLGEPPPLQLAAEQPVERDRLTAALRIIWVIPQFVVLFFVGIAAFVVAFIGWFAALFTGQLPDFAVQFLTGWIRWATRVSAYFYFLTDEYPPFSLEEDLSYPVKIRIPSRSRLNPLAVLFRIILVIPAAIVSSVVGSGAFLIAVASWFMITFTGREPAPLYEVLRVFVRYQTRVGGYFFMLTPEYPWGIMGDPAVMGVSEAGDEAWTIQLSPSGRTAMIVTIILGIITEVLNRSTYWRHY